MILAAEFIPSPGPLPVRLMLGRNSGIRRESDPPIPGFLPGNAGGKLKGPLQGSPRFPIWPGIRESPIPDSAGNGTTGTGLGIGVPIRRMGISWSCDN